MNIESELALSYYQEVAEINKHHGVFLVQHRETHQFFVKKILQVYDYEVFKHLRSNPVPHMPRIYELIQAGNDLIIIEDYISGTNLEILLSQKHHLPEDEAVDIAIKLCDILQVLHNSQPPIIHRDIKPGNVIITPDKAVYLLDLNAARRDTQHHSEDTVLLGTKGYAAPEQYGFGSSDVTTDIYALGMLLNTLLTGEVSRENIAACTCEKVIRKCLQIDRHDRYQSVKSVKAALLGQATPQEWMKYLPPGFRQGNIFHMVTAIVGYFSLYAGIDGIHLSNIEKGTNPWGDTIFISLGGILTILFASNYLGIQRIVPSISRHKKYMKWLIITAVCAAIMFIFLFLAMMFDSVMQ